jgi:hypothetical protein
MSATSVGGRNIQRLIERVRGFLWQRDLPLKKAAPFNGHRTANAARVARWQFFWLVRAF